MPSEYEDKYLLLRDENTTLKKKKNEQEATIKRMYTKLAIIEEKLTKKRQIEDKNNQDDPDTGGNKAAVVPVRRDLDTEKFIAALKNENTTLRKKNQSLMEKNRWLEEQSRGSNSLKRLGGTIARTPMQKRPAARTTTARNEGFPGSTLEKQAESARKLHRDTFSGDLEVDMKKRLVIAEKQLMKLQKENEQLRTSSNSLLLKPRRDNNEGSGPSDDEDDNNKEPINLEIDQLKRELRDRQAQLAILNARYENLESNALAEREIQEKTLEQMEQMNRQVHKLRTQLQDAVMEKEEMEIRMMKAGDQEKDIAQLREQNRRLEERMTSLCESPFINDAFQRKERIDKLFDLEKLAHEQKATIAHMTEENQKLQGVIRELQISIKQLKQAKDRVEMDLERMAHHLMEERNARSLETIKSSSSTPVPRPEPFVIVRPRTPETQHQPPEKRDACSSPVKNNASPPKVYAPSLPIAGGIVGRKYGEMPTTASFLDAEEDNSVKHLRNRVHVLQIAHLKSMQELERCEKMLHAQTNINRELALEIEELTTSKISSSNQLQRRMKELELLCEARQQRIHVLQAEIKQLKYAREKMLLRDREADDASSDGSFSGDEGSEVASLSESLILAARDLAPGEQLLELGIMSGNFDSSVVGINSSTFVLCDFYDFESQSTPLLMGNRPEYNLSATFKVTVDGFFLRYLASESVVLEVHQAIRGDFKLIGKASIRLSKLLQSKGVVKESSLAVRSIASNDGGAAVLGSLNVVLRLSTPISEIWQLHLRSYPQDMQLLSAARKSGGQEVTTDVFCDEDFCADAEDHSTNVLQVTVFGCRNLRSYGKRSDGSASRVPSSYAHYQLLGFPDVFTNIVPESSSPEYDLGCSRQAFTLAVDACLLRFFSKCRLWITVFDDQAELDDNMQEDGMIGKCGLLLSDLVDGENVRGWFSLKDQNEQHAGDVSVLIQWKDPFQVLQLTSSQRARGINGRPIDIHSLDFDQQHSLLAMFSSDLDGRVNYCQFLHYAAPSEELELLVAKLKERLEHAIDSELASSVQDALTAGADTSQRKRMLVPVNTILKAGEKYGIFLSDAERGLLLATFGTADISPERTWTTGNTAGDSIGHEELISLNYLLLHINPRLSCTERLLCHKIRQTVRGYLQEQRKRKAAGGVPAPKLFEKFDEALCGRVNRSAFRKCLSALGFDLMNIESEYRELVRNHTKQLSSEGIQSDLVANETSPSQGAIDLDEDVVEDVTAKVKQVAKASMVLPRETEVKASRSVTQNEVPTMDASELTGTSVPATTEFRRRKQAFMDRMKAIASASSKNLVYEEVEKKLLGQKKEQGAIPLPRHEVLKQQLVQLHAPHNIHHGAAKMLQRQYRQFKKQQQLRHFKTFLKDAPVKVQHNSIKSSAVPDADTARAVESKPPLSSDNETRLTCALEAAVKFSLAKFQKSFVQFQEFCIIHHFGEIAPAKLWRQMDANGLVELLSKRGAGLLSQKFLSSSYDEDELESGSKLSVSLKAVHTFLKAFLNNAPAKEQHSSMKSSAVPEPEAAPVVQPIPPRTPITILSEFISWCDEHGIDLRGEIEINDDAYTGFVTAMELKHTLLRLGITKVASPSSAEAVIGLLIRQFRSAEQTDAVHYTVMLYNATNLGPDPQWHAQISEHLRSRIRLKANFAGKIDHSDPTNYLKLDAAFSHFDCEKKGFLTAGSLQRGLRALQYELSMEQLSILMTQMCIFRHTGGGLSRTEFDSFVLDPYGFGLLKTLSDQLYAEVDPHSQDTLPRVAYLSRLLIECGGIRDESSLPKEVFWTQLERVLERQLERWERSRLQHLFDVSRDGQIAYKLFLKVMSRWRTPVNPLRNITAMEQRPAAKPEKPEKQLRFQENAKGDDKPPCNCDDILRSLYNRMSSIDFDSQVDIVEEYLRLKDRKHTGSITMKQLKKVFDQIGLSLSADAFTSLQMFFPGIASSSAEEEQEELVAYEKILLALQVLHED